MSQTILIEPDEELRKLFSLNLTTYAGTDIIDRKNAQDAIDLITILPNISLIITRNNVGSENTAQKLFDYVKAEMLDIPVLVIGDVPALKDKALVLAEPISWELLVKGAAKLLGITAEDLAKRARPEFVPVSLSYFYDITQTPCDIYIRIRKSPTESQFVKRIHSKDIFDSQIIKKYEDSGLREFYVARDYQQYFVTFVTNNIVQKLENKGLKIEDRILTTSRSYDIVADQIQHMGLDQAGIELADAGISSMITSVQDSPQIAELLKFLFSNKISQAYQQSHMTALACQYILSKQSWSQAKHLEILSFVSFFSDITLKSESQLRIYSSQDLEAANLTPEEKLEVKDHAKNASDILDLHPKMSEYRKTVLLQHHGSMTGEGYVDNPGEDLHPLSKVFVVADAFVKILLRPDMPSYKRDILPILFQRFTNPSYQKIIKALEMKFQ